MAADGVRGVEKACTVLNECPFVGIGIVAAPDLRCVIQHPGIKPSAAAGAALEEDVREGFRETVEQVIDPEHVPVMDLTLPVFRQIIGVPVRQGPVHVPLHVGDVIVCQQLRKHLEQVVHHFGIGHVQHQLIPPAYRTATRGLQHPVRMCAVEIAVFIDHLRLDPDPEIQTCGIDFLNERLQGSLEFLFVDLPVPQSGIVGIPAPEPAVVQHQQVDVHVRRLPGNVQDRFPVKVEIRCLPGVDQHRTGPVFEPGRYQPLADQAVKTPRQCAQSFIAANQHRLRGLEVFTRTQFPAETIGVDAHDQAGLSELVHFHIRPEASGIHQHGAHGPAVCFRGVRTCEDHSGILLVTGCAPGGTCRYDALLQAAARELPFLVVAAREGDQVHRLSMMDIQRQTRGAVQPDRPAGAVFKPRTADDRIVFFIRHVEQVAGHVCDFVCEMQHQCLQGGVGLPDPGQSFQRRTPVQDLVPFIPEVQAPAVFQPRRADAVVTGAFTGVLLEPGVQRIGAVVAGIRNAAGKPHIGIVLQVVHDLAAGFRPIPQMGHNVVAVSLDLIAGVFCFYLKNAVSNYLYGQSLFPRFLSSIVNLPETRSQSSSRASSPDLLSIHR